MRRTITEGHPEWPKVLQEVSPPPKKLFVDGRPIDPDSPKISIVGTRKPTIAGVEIAERLAHGLTQGGFTIVSGLAVGIDAVAHRACLDAGGTTIAVLGCGLDVAYPRPNLALRDRITAEGTLVTEYEEGTQPRASNFPQRNRIVAALCSGVVVVEGALRSGALITAHLALEANRNVYAVPGSLRNPMAAGPNALIARGEAQLITTFKDICDDLAPSFVWAASKADGPTIDEDELSVLSALDDAPSNPDQLSRALHLSMGRLAMALSRLEVRGWATRGPAGYSLSSSGGRIRSRLTL